VHALVYMLWIEALAEHWVNSQHHAQMPFDATPREHVRREECSLEKRLRGLEEQLAAWEPPADDSSSSSSSSSSTSGSDPDDEKKKGKKEKKGKKDKKKGTKGARLAEVIDELGAGNPSFAVALGEAVQAAEAYGDGDAEEEDDDWDEEEWDAFLPEPKQEFSSSECGKSVYSLPPHRRA